MTKKETVVCTLRVEIEPDGHTNSSLSFGVDAKNKLDPFSLAVALIEIEMLLQRAIDKANKHELVKGIYQELRAERFTPEGTNH